MRHGYNALLHPLHWKMTGLLLLALIAYLPGSSRADTFSTFYNFSLDNNRYNSDGIDPAYALIQASDGNFYGTCVGGGTNGNGTIFKITPEGVFTTLYSFSALDNYGYNQDGCEPLASLMQANDGNLYGTTTSGGANGFGTIFQITTGGVFTILHTFSATSSGNYNGDNIDGVSPYAPLMQANDGNLYGTTTGGGASGHGTIFRITLTGTLTTLYNFTGAADGAEPEAALIQARDGALYGTAGGGSNGSGVIYKITPSGAFTPLYSFSARDYHGYNQDGSGSAALIQASDGDLYGTTVLGGANGGGTIYKVTPEGVFITLYSFSAGSNSPPYANPDGAHPMAGLIQANDGNFYGAAPDGGTNGNGTIFQITPLGVFTTLYSFSAYDNIYPYIANPDGAFPSASLIQAGDGKLYGACEQGGANGNGTLITLDVGLAPTLAGLSSSSANAGGPGFTITLKGASFAGNSVACWTAGYVTTRLTTTFVSTNELKAAVPASLIASPGKAALTVAATGISASNHKLFSIKVTTLKLTGATLSKDSAGNYVAHLTLQNAGNMTATNVTIKKSSLGAAGTSTTLPVSLGSIAAGATGSINLTYPTSAGSSGSVITLTVSGAFTGGTLSGSMKVILP